MINSFKYYLSANFEMVSSIVIQNIYHLFLSSKVGDRSRGWPEGSLFNSYYTEV